HVKGEIQLRTTPRASAGRSTSGGLSGPGTATSVEGVGLFISAVGCPSDLCAANQFASDRRQQEPRIRDYLAGSNGTGSPVSDVGCCRVFLPLRIECPIRVHQGIHEPFWVPRAACISVCVRRWTRSSSVRQRAAH